MALDPFDFITTRLEEPKDLTSVRDQIGLMPTIPADFRSFSNQSLSPVTNPQSLVDSIAQGVAKLPDNKPAYSYTTQQENRYSNPNLQYTPYNILGTDTEDIYGRNQSKWNQIRNALVKTGANTVGTFTSAFLTIPATLDLIRSGHPIDAFAEDHLFSGVQDWLTALEDKYPNYYTEWEREHPYMSGLPFSGGATNFWGDKVIKNIGFSIGALGAGLVQDSLIELASGGIATPAAFIATANQLGKFKSNMFRGFRNLIKGAENIDEVIDVSKMTGNLAKGLEVSKLSQIGTGARFAGISYLNAQGESFIEGYHTYLDTKKQLLEQAINSRDTSPETLNKLEQLSQDAGRYTTGLNIPILTLSNLIQFPNLLYGKSMLGKEIAKDILSIEAGEKGLEALNKFTLKKGLKEWALESLKDAASEGFEEGAQYHISNSLHDYYVDRMNPKIKQSLMEYVIKNIPNSLTDKQFWEETFLGALSGLMMGAPAALPLVVKGKERYDQLAATINNSLQHFNSTVNQFAKTIDLAHPAADQEVSKHDALFSTVHDSLKFGTFETFQDSLEDLKGIDLESYNKTFQTEFTSEAERNQSVNDMIEESYKMKGDILKVNRFYSKNPYSTPYLLDKIKKVFSSKSQTELNSIQENLFNDFKEVVARNESLLRKTNGLVLQHKDNLKQLGVKNESIDYMANLARSPKGVKSYLDFKQAQIKDLQKQVEYYQSLSQADTTLTPEVKPKEELKKAQRLLNDTQDYYDRVTGLHKQLKDDPKNEDLQQELLYEVINEETNKDQRNKYVEERKKKQRELEEAQAAEDKLKEENDDLNKQEQSKTAEQLINLNEQVQDQAESLPEKSPVPEPIIPENQWLDKYNTGNQITSKGKNYKIIGKNEDSLIVEDDKGIRHQAIKKNNRWTLKPLGPEGEDIEPLEPLEPLSIPEQDTLNPNQIDDIVAEYLAEPEDTKDIEGSTITKQVPTLTILPVDFTREEIVKHPNTVWIKAKDSLVDGVFVYSIEDDKVRKRRLLGTQTPLEIGEYFKSFVTSELPDSMYHQILRDEEQPIDKEIKQEDNNLDKFLGEYKDLKEIFQQQIDRGKFELIC